MFNQILNTWTIYILLPVLIPTFTSGAVIGEGSKVIKEPKTMYDAVANKCPNLEKTNLKENEIFTKKCLNWALINATSSFSTDTKSNVECLVFYEALVSFCTGMGDTLRQVQDFIPASIKDYNYKVSSVCADKHNLYPLNKTEHNISNLIRTNDDCFLLCIDYSLGHMSDICKFAYFFTSFNISKFAHDLKAVHQSSAVGGIVPVQEQAKDNSSASIAAVNNTKPESTPIKPVLDKTPHNIDVHASAPKPQLSQGAQQDQNILAKSDTKVESKPEDKPAELPDAKIPKSPVQEQRPENISLPIVAPGENIDSQLPVPKQEAKAKAQDSPPNGIPEKEKTSDIKAKPQPEPEENPEYVDENKSLGNGDVAVPEELEEEGEGEQDDGDIKAEPVMPEENNESKTTKKLKPNTVEDEAVSSFNAPEDNMDGDSYFFSYFTVIMCLFIVGYVGYHNRQKVLALILEGKKGKRAGRGRRPNSANYHKLDTNLEEAISSSCTKTASNVIY